MSDFIGPTFLFILYVNDITYVMQSSKMRWYRDMPRSWPLFSGQSVLPSLPNYHQCAVHVPPFSNFRKILNCQPCFWSKFQLSRCTISKSLLWIPLIFLKENLLPRPCSGNPHSINPPKQSWVPLLRKMSWNLQILI